MRNPPRALPVLFLLVLAVLVPLVLSGYAELRQASSAPSHLEAARHYWSAAQRVPWRADLFELAGHEFYYAQEYAQADAVYRKAFQRHALTAEGWVAWGDVNYLNSNPIRAAELWEQGLDQANPSESLYSRLAQTYQENGDFAKAAEYLQRYVANHLTDASAHYRLGLLLTLSDPQAAISELIIASQINPEFDPAVQILRSALNLASLNDSPSERFVITGRGLGLVAEWDLAVAAFKEAAKTDATNAEAWAWLAEADQQAGEDERLEQIRNEAMEYLDQALSWNPNSAVVRTLRGLYFQRVGNNRAALTEFQYAATLQPDDPALYVSIGESHAKLGDLIRALEAYQYAANLNPKDAGYWRLLAQFCGQNNIRVLDVGVPAAQRALALEWNDSVLEDLLGWLWLISADYPGAERHLLRALELDPQNASAQFHLGMLFLQTGDRAAAFDHLVQARDLGNADAQALLNQYFP